MTNFISQMTKPPITNHVAFKYFSDLNYLQNNSGPGLPFLILFVLYLAYFMIIRPILNMKCCRHISNVINHTIDIDEHNATLEGFDPYFENIAQ